jgi:hypothetical protein
VRRRGGDAERAQDLATELLELAVAGRTSIRLVTMTMGEQSRVRIASSTFG